MACEKFRLLFHMHKEVLLIVHINHVNVAKVDGQFVIMALLYMTILTWF
jgi:hypothetical protein